MNKRPRKSDAAGLLTAAYAWSAWAALAAALAWAAWTAWSGLR